MKGLPAPGHQVAVRKLLWGGKPGYTWSGHVAEVDREKLVIEAVFQAGHRDLGYVVFEMGDLFFEFYYFQRWFNIEQVYSTDGDLKGWYCNIAMPPAISDYEISFVDLAADVFVYPDGRYLLLDQEEFEADIRDLYPPEVGRAARDGLAELLSWIEQGSLPSRQPARPGFS